MIYQIDIFLVLEVIGNTILADFMYIGKAKVAHV